MNTRQGVEHEEVDVQLLAVAHLKRTTLAVTVLFVSKKSIRSLLQFPIRSWESFQGAFSESNRKCYFGTSVWYSWSAPEATLGTRPASQLKI